MREGKGGKIEGGREKEGEGDRDGEGRETEPEKYAYGGIFVHLVQGSLFLKTSTFPIVSFISQS